MPFITALCNEFTNITKNIKLRIRLFNSNKINANEELIKGFAQLMNS